MAALTVDVWIDFGCPYSRVGLIQLEDAIHELGHIVNLKLHAFRMDPDAPADYGQTTIEALCSHLNIDADQANKMLDAVREFGAKFDVNFNFDIARGGNTFDAHRLIKLATLHNQQFKVSRALFKAHFEDGLLLSDQSVLQHIALDAGIPASEVNELLAGDKFANEVLEDEAQVLAKGITQTPTFFFNGQNQVVGAFPTSDYFAALKQAVDQSH